MQNGNKVLYLTLVLTSFIILIFSGCKKESDPPVPPLTTITDADGNVYHTITLGTQVWMVENLKTTKFNDGTPISLVTDGDAWKNLSTPGFCWYTNDEGYKNIYGALYNWFAVSSGKLAPAGWHIPSEAEWTILIDFLGGNNLAGGKLKEAGLLHWISPNTGATNSSGFSAIPGGTRNGYDGSFNNLGEHCDFWSVTENGTTLAKDFDLFSFNAAISPGSDSKIDGNSVRCIKN